MVTKKPKMVLRNSKLLLIVSVEDKNRVGLKISQNIYIKNNLLPG